jgi:hypothetical protein
MDAPTTEAERNRIGVPCHSIIKVWIGERRAERKRAQITKAWAKAATRCTPLKEIAILTGWALCSLCAKKNRADVLRAAGRSSSLLAERTGENH